MLGYQPQPSSRIAKGLPLRAIALFTKPIAAVERNYLDFELQVIMDEGVDVFSFYQLALLSS